MTADDASARFFADAGDHLMTVVHDDGLYRHLRFRAREWRPPYAHPFSTSYYWFDLITVPRTLIFQGDGDSYVFSRVDDMFEFFRGPVGRINPGYWMEKVTSGRDHITRYDPELMEQEIRAAVEEAAGADDRLSGLAEDVCAHLVDDLTGNESIDRSRVNDYRYWIDDAARHGRFDYSSGKPVWVPAAAPDFEFVDAWEWHLQEPDWWFLWACHAIVWGIAQYDVAKGTRTVEEIHRVPVPLTATLRPAVTPIDTTPSEAFL